jgi:hypothetical protein
MMTAFRRAMNASLLQGRKPQLEPGQATSEFGHVTRLAMLLAAKIARSKS